MYENSAGLFPTCELRPFRLSTIEIMFRLPIHFLVGFLFAYASVGILYAQDDESRRFVAISDLIRKEKLIEAAKEIQRFEDDNLSSERLWLLRCSWFNTLRHSKTGVSAEIDLIDEAQKHFKATRVWIDKDARNLFRMNYTLDSMYDLLAETKGQATADSFFQDALQFIDSPEHEQLGPILFGTLQGLHLIRWDRKHEESQRSETIAQLEKVLTRAEHFAETHPESEIAKTKVIEVKREIYRVLPFGKQDKHRTQVMALATDFLEHMPTSQSRLSLYVATVEFFAKSLWSSEPETASELVNECLRRVQNLERVNPSLSGSSYRIKSNMLGVLIRLEESDQVQREVGQRLTTVDGVKWIHGAPLDFQQLSGKIVLFWIWSFQSENENAQMQRLQELQAKYSDHGVYIVSCTNPGSFLWDARSNKTKYSNNASVASEELVASIKDFLAFRNTTLSTLLFEHNSKFASSYGRANLILSDGTGTIRAIREVTDDRTLDFIETKIKEILQTK